MTPPPPPRGGDLLTLVWCLILFFFPPTYGRRQLLRALERSETEGLPSSHWSGVSVPEPKSNKGRCVCVGVGGWVDEWGVGVRGGFVES